MPSKRSLASKAPLRRTGECGRWGRRGRRVNGMTQLAAELGGVDYREVVILTYGALKKPLK